MKLFLDTSAIFKLYHQEKGSSAIESIFTNNTVSAIVLSEFTKIEFHSASWKKVRIAEITASDAKRIISVFNKDVLQYQFIHADTIITNTAKELVDKYGMQGLRTLDSIQLATAISLKELCGLFVTTDKLLNSFFQQESLPVL